MSSTGSDGLPPLPPKVPKPQSRGNIGPGKLYKDQAAFELAIDTWKRQKEERAVLVRRREQAMKQAREKRHDRSGREQQHLSGAAKRQKANTAVSASQNRERNRTHYYQRIRAAREKGCSDGDWFISGFNRWRAEKELLGKRFVEEGQRVRVVSAGALNGRCGTIIKRAQVCGEDAQHQNVTTWPEKDASGRLKLDKLDQCHHVLLDPGCDGDVGQRVELSPRQVEAWPRIGQRVRILDAPGGGQQYGTVESFCTPFNGYMAPKHRGCYSISRPLFVASQDLAFVGERGDIGPLMPDTSEPVYSYLTGYHFGSTQPRRQRVHLLPPLPEALLLGSELQPSLAPSSTADDVFYIDRPDSICKSCRDVVRAAEAAQQMNPAAAELQAARARLSSVCVKVKHVAKLPPSMFEPIEDNRSTDVVDIPHYRCEHMADPAFAEYALFAYDCSIDPRIWDVAGDTLREPEEDSEWCAWLGVRK